MISCIEYRIYSHDVNADFLYAGLNLLILKCTLYQINVSKEIADTYASLVSVLQKRFL